MFQIVSDPEMAKISGSSVLAPVHPEYNRKVLPILNIVAY